MEKSFTMTTVIDSVLKELLAAEPKKNFTVEELINMSKNNTPKYIGGTIVSGEFVPSNNENLRINNLLTFKRN